MTEEAAKVKQHLVCGSEFDCEYLGPPPSRWLARARERWARSERHTSANATPFCVPATSTVKISLKPSSSTLRHAKVAPCSSPLPLILLEPPGDAAYSILAHLHPAQRLGDPVDLPDRDPRELIWPCKCIPAGLR